MQNFALSPRALLGGLWRHRGLVATLARREVIGRYRGSVMGILWSLFHPMLMLAVYTFVFSVVFRARWDSGGDSKTEFALVLFAGLMVFNLFAECVNRAPALVLANINYVKKVVFPLEILPWVTMIAALFHFSVSLLVWLAFYCLLRGVPSATALLLPVVLLPLLLLTLGVSWLLASLGVYLRDVSQIVGIVTTALMFLSPIFYPLSSLPQPYLTILAWNPLTPSIEQARDVLIWGRALNPAAYALQLLAAALVAWLGFAWFQKTRKGFADVV